MRAIKSMAGMLLALLLVAISGPAAARFVSADPVKANPNTGANFNRYYYANNNPYKYTDPDGRQSREMNWENKNIHKVTPPPRAEGDWLGPAIGVALTGVLAAPAAAEAGMVALTNPGAVAAATEVAAGAAGVTGTAGAVAKTITLSAKAQGQAAQHVKDAIAAGKPSVLTIARGGANANRAASIGGMAKVPGKHLDEYPPAMFKEGGAGASVRAINPADNMSAGACIGNACRGLADGARVLIDVVD